MYVVSKFFLLFLLLIEILLNTCILQGFIKLFKSESKDILNITYNVTFK